MQTRNRNRRIPREIIYRILDNTDLVALVGERVRLKRAGKDFVGLCPFHDEKTPSFTVSPHKRFYHCFGCGAHGSAIDFVMQTQGLRFVDAVSLLAEQAGITVTHTYQTDAESGKKKRVEAEKLANLNERMLRRFRSQFPGSPAEAYLLKTRGLRPETIERFQAGYDRKRHRVVFPIHDARGRVAGFSSRLIDAGNSASGPKYINSKESALFEKRKLLFGLSQLFDEKPRPREIIVTEGCLDVLALHSHGVVGAVAVLGTGFTTEHAHTLYRLADRLVLVFDADEAGFRATRRAVEVVAPLLREGRYLKIVRLDSGDPDEYIRRHGADAFRRALTQAPLFSEWLQRDFRARFPKNVEGESLYRREVSGILDRMPPSHFKQALRKTLGVASDASGGHVQTRRPVVMRRGRSNTGRVDSCDRLMALVLTHTELAGALDDRVPTALAELYGDRGNLACRVLSRLRDGVGVAVLRERIRGHAREPLFDRWFHLWVERNPETARNLVREIGQYVLNQYDKLLMRRSIETLLSKSPDELTETDRRRIDEYVRRLREAEADSALGWHGRRVDRKKHEGRLRL